MQLSYADDERDKLQQELKVVHMGHRLERERLERDLAESRAETLAAESRIDKLSAAKKDEAERQALRMQILELEDRVVGADRLAQQGVRAARAERDVALQDKVGMAAELEAAKAELAESKKLSALIGLLRSDRDRLSDELREAQHQVTLDLIIHLMPSIPHAIQPSISRLSHCSSPFRSLALDCHSRSRSSSGWAAFVGDRSPPDLIDFLDSIFLI